jgi:hypothetical protein
MTQGLPLAASRLRCNTLAVENASEVVPPQVSTGAPQQVQVTVNIDWSQIAAVEPQLVNQVMGQLAAPLGDGVPDGIYIGIGVVAPPIVNASDPQAVRRLADQLQGTSLSVTPYGRFYVSRAFLDVIIQTLQKTADQYDSIDAQVEARRSEARGQE